MFISVFDIFKIGIGPSSSHTMGPMTAAGQFLQAMQKATGNKAKHLQASLHGSLAYTGKGHASDRAVILGLAGYMPDTIDSTLIDSIIKTIYQEKSITSLGFHKFRFDPATDVIFDFGPPLAGHANGMRFFAFDEDGEELFQQTYYSIGGGFVVTEEELSALAELPEPIIPAAFPYSFNTATQMLAMGNKANFSIAEMKRANELVLRDARVLDDNLDQIWEVMAECAERGLLNDETLPGGLSLKRRAKALHDKLQAEFSSPDKPPHFINEWLALYAIAVNEENAAGGKIVTAPTNGAAGVIPAVISYYLKFCSGAQINDVRDFLLVAGAIGGIIKHNGSISGAEVGCQGEVGSASAMAAAGLCSVLGGTNEQIENAAEIALEHHLGMTCDPINGLVQIPCIERNGFGAVKAVTAASLALRGDGGHFVSLDNCIKTMYDTGRDMHTKYKETSLGGLAVNVIEC
jgi:L-serine dehydratase